ncbi:MAG: lactate utilization protein [Oscillospiraceae bacterium]
MNDYASVIETFRAEGFNALYFGTSAEAVAYITSEIRGTTVGIGGSMTIDQLGLYDKLRETNTVYWHRMVPGPETLKNAAEARVYLSSVNGLSRTGEIINIDGAGNRVAATLYGHERVMFVAGINKLADSFDAALYRARNIAAPLNCKRLGKKTPCALSPEMRCYDCKSPDRICRGFTVLARKMSGIPQMDLILVGEELGY